MLLVNETNLARKSSSLCKPECGRGSTNDADDGCVITDAILKISSHCEKS